VLVAADAGAAKTGQSTTTAHPSPKPVDPDQEVKLLHQAQDALAADPAQALSLCGEHAKSFPQGLLAQEREVIAIDALVRLGRANEAHARARRFAASYPASTHLRRIEALLEKAR
jgi:outer membrane protein assembly factor BamD (BamD/ComL family)